MTDWEKWDRKGQAMQQIGCAGIVFFFVVLPLLFVLYAIITS